MSNDKNIEKMEKLDADMDAVQLQRIKSANEQRIKLMNKYLPALKSTEVTGEGGGELIARIERHIVNASA